jgi:hypothetical protein
MRKSSLFVVAATLIATGFGVWAASTTTDAGVAGPPVGQAVEPFQLMMNARELPAAEFVDYTFVFNLSAAARKRGARGASGRAVAGSNTEPSIADEALRGRPSTKEQYNAGGDFSDQDGSHPANVDGIGVCGQLPVRSHHIGGQRRTA